MPDRRVTSLTRAVVVAAVFCLLFPAGSFAATLKIGGTGSALATMRILADEFVRLRPDISVEIPDSLGSGGGIKALLAGALDIALSSRMLKPKERDAGARATPYATTPFVLVTRVSESNSAPDLSSKELVKAFSGDAVHWKDGTAIRIILRNERDTSTRILIAAFDGMDAALTRARAIPGIPVTSTEQDNMDLAETLPGALTTASLTAILSEERSLAPIAIDGVAPTLENLATGAYKISKYFYLVTGPETSETALEFIRFIRSAEGAAILRTTGNLAVSPLG